MNCAHWESLLAGWFRGGEHVGPYLPRDQRDSPFVLLEAREIQRGTACYRIEVSHREFSYIRTQWLVPVSPRSKQEQMFGLLKFEKNCVIRCHSKTMPDPYQPRGYLPHFRQCGEVTNISHIFPPPSCWPPPQSDLTFWHCAVIKSMRTTSLAKPALGAATRAAQRCLDLHKSQRLGTLWTLRYSSFIECGRGDFAPPCICFVGPLAWWN